MISADPHILISGAPAYARMREYAGLFDGLHIIVFTREYYKDAHESNLFLYAGYGRFLPIRFFRAWRMSRAILRHGRYEVITAQGADETGALAWILARSFNLPFQLQIHTDIMSPHYRRAGWKEYLRYRIGRFLIPHAACVRVVSERIRGSLISAESRIFQTKFPRKLSLETRIATLPIFTDVSKYIAAVSDPETEQRFAGYDFKVIAVGRFVDKEKNFSMLIDAMRIFVRINPQALLVIVGEGPDRENYQLSIIKYQLQKNVILEPWRDDLHSFYKSFDLFVSASHYEGWGRAVIEAMAAGLPVVMTDTGLAGEVVKNGENGIVVPVGDTQAFLSAIKTLYGDPQKRKQLAAAACQTAKNLQPQTREEYLIRYRASFDP